MWRGEAADNERNLRRNSLAHNHETRAMYRHIRRIRIASNQQHSPSTALDIGNHRNRNPRNRREEARRNEPVTPMSWARTPCLGSSCKPSVTDLASHAGGSNTAVTFKRKELKKDDPQLWAAPQVPSVASRHPVPSSATAEEIAGSRKRREGGGNHMPLPDGKHS
jgi:hypothetical protein